MIHSTKYNVKFSLPLLSSGLMWITQRNPSISPICLSTLSLRAQKAYCHCIDDRKLNNTQVFQVPKANFAITAGKPKTFTKQSDHGRVCEERTRITSICKIKCMTYISQRARVNLVSLGHSHTLLP
jgi:hypothetical protein